MQQIESDKGGCRIIDLAGYRQALRRLNRMGRSDPSVPFESVKCSYENQPEIEREDAAPVASRLLYALELLYCGLILLIAGFCAAVFFGFL